MPQSSLHGKVAIVTGAAGGFGRVLVRALLAEGARVAALDVDEDRLHELRASLADHGDDRLLAKVTDIADYAACEQAVADTIDTLRGLHILINNGAIGMGTIRNDHLVKLVGILEITPAMWQRFAAVNFSGAWNVTRAAIAHLLDQRWGRIITVTTSFFTMLRGGFHPYGPCKAGLEAMAAGHAREFQGTGVTVNVVIPGGSNAADGITGNRYVAALWDASKPPAEAEHHCRAPIAWPDLAQNPVWPGDKPAK